MEDFANPWETFARGVGDCDDLVAYRLTELKARGIGAVATRSEWLKENVHVLIRLPNGDTEDPSIKLGAY